MRTRGVVLVVFLALAAATIPATALGPQTVKILRDSYRVPVPTEMGQRVGELAALHRCAGMIS